MTGDLVKLRTIDKLVSTYYSYRGVHFEIRYYGSPSFVDSSLYLYEINSVFNANTTASFLADMTAVARAIIKRDDCVTRYDGGEENDHRIFHEVKSWLVFELVLDRLDVSLFRRVLKTGTILTPEELERGVVLTREETAMLDVYLQPVIPSSELNEWDPFLACAITACVHKIDRLIDDLLVFETPTQEIPFRQQQFIPR